MIMNSISIFGFQGGLNTKPQTTLDIWNSPQCQSFYRKGYWDDRQTPNNKLLVAEDLFYSGRGFAMGAFHHEANEVFISKEHKLVYVEVRKAASSTIRQILRDYFSGSWTCTIVVNGIPSPVPACTVFDGRCSTLCLTEEELSDYFFFSFVRNPLDRFYSGYQQACQSQDHTMSQEHMFRVLRNMTANNYYWDPHLETMAYSLSSPVQVGGVYRSAPVHFIGKVENLKNDFLQLLTILKNRRLEGAFPDVEEQLNLMHNHNEATKEARLLGNATSDALIQQAYAQDFACFGYKNNR